MRFENPVPVRRNFAGKKQILTKIYPRNAIVKELSIFQCKSERETFEIENDN